MKGFEGWRHSRQLQDELLDTLEAGLGADDVSLATLSDSGMVYWLAHWPQGPQELRAYAQVRVKGWSPGARTSYKQPSCIHLQASKLRGYRVYMGYETTRLQAARIQLQAARIQRLQGYLLQEYSSQPGGPQGAGGYIYFVCRKMPSLLSPRMGFIRRALLLIRMRFHDVLHV